MKAVVRLLTACVLSATVAGGLAYVQNSRSGTADGGIPVFSQRPKPLTTDNIVDKLSPLALTLKIARVDWKEPTLALDLWMNQTDTDSERVYNDLYLLTKLGFTGTSNVNQLLIRVLAKDEGQGTGKRLLLTMDARRGKFAWSDPKISPGNGVDLKSVLESNAALTYTALWKARFGG